MMMAAESILSKPVVFLRTIAVIFFLLKLISPRIQYIVYKLRFLFV